MHPNPLARPRFGGTPLGRRPRLLRGRPRLLRSRPRLLRGGSGLLRSRPRPTLRARFAALSRLELAVQLLPWRGLPRRSLPGHRARIRHHALRRRALVHGLRGTTRVSPRALVALLPAVFRLPVDLAVLPRVDVVAPIDRSRRVAGGRSRDVTHTLGKTAVDVVLNLHGTDVSCRWVEPDDRTAGPTVPGRRRPAPTPAPGRFQPGGRIPPG